jgi:hypothetical protein
MREGRGQYRGKKSRDEVFLDLLPVPLLSRESDSDSCYGKTNDNSENYKDEIMLNKMGKGRKKIKGRK